MNIPTVRDSSAGLSARSHRAAFMRSPPTPEDARLETHARGQRGHRLADRGAEAHVGGVGGILVTDLRGVSSSTAPMTPQG